jgi:glycosyltransferase involved in cell wall biosynthesis
VRILFVTDFFPPETNAAASRVFERARYWVRWGHEVTVLTSAPNFPMGKLYDGYRNRWLQEEQVEGMRVVRVKTYMARNQGKWRRGLDFLSFFMTAFPVGVFLGRHDVVAATSPNFFAGLAGSFIALTRGRPFVLEIGDLWPAFISTLGAVRLRPVIRLLEVIELFMYRRADRVVCLTKGFKDNLVAREVPEDKIEVILNGVDTEFFTAGAPEPVDIDRYNPGQRFTVGYYGTQGAAHGLEAVLDVARQLPDVHFLFVGAGAATETLKGRIRDLGLGNVTMVSMQPREMMPRLWRLCDAALVQLRDLPLLNSAIPSKIFEAMATGRPILLAAPEGDASSLVVGERCGLHVPFGNPSALADAIRKLLVDEALQKRLGDEGLAAAQRHSREQQASLMLDVLEAAVG